MTAYQDATSNFVNGARDVVGAVDKLKTALDGGDPADVTLAEDLVASAADSYLDRTRTYQQKGLHEIAAAPRDAALRQERIVTDLLAGSLVDLEVGNTILLAARAAESHAPPTSAADLGAVSEELDNLMNKLAAPLGELNPPAHMARFGLDELPVALHAASTLNQTAAKKNFEKQVAEVFAVLVDESKRVVLVAFESIKDFDFEKLLGALGTLGRIALELPHVSKLITKALAIVSRAVEKLSDVLSVDKKLDAIKEVARKIQQYIQNPSKPLEDLLESSYRKADTKKRLHDLVKKTDMDRARLDQGAKELNQLRIRFAEQMALLTRIVGGVKTANEVVSFFAPAATTMLLFGSLHVLAMSYAVLAGMDFADSEGPLNFVNGVLKISDATLS